MMSELAAPTRQWIGTRIACGQGARVVACAFGDPHPEPRHQTVLVTADKDGAPREIPADRIGAILASRIVVEAVADGRRVEVDATERLLSGESEIPNALGDGGFRLVRDLTGLEPEEVRFDDALKAYFGAGGADARDVRDAVKLHRVREALVGGHANMGDRETDVLLRNAMQAYARVKAEAEAGQGLPAAELRRMGAVLRANVIRLMEASFAAFPSDPAENWLERQRRQACEDVMTWPAAKARAFMRDARQNAVDFHA